MPPIAVDGAMGTTLISMGLPSATPADTWVDARPEAIAEVHRRFVDAGAAVVRTATLCTRIDQDPEAFPRLVAAVELAARSNPQEIWLSIGPMGPRRKAMDGLRRVAELHVHKLLLETFVDPEECLQTTQILAELGIPVVASMVPGEDGLLLSGDPYPARALREAGASVLGINCGTDATQAAACFERHFDGGAWFVAPAFGPDLANVLTQVGPRCAYLGACCGTDPERWEDVWPR